MKDLEVIGEDFLEVGSAVSVGQVSTQEVIGHQEGEAEGLEQHLQSLASGCVPARSGPKRATEQLLVEG
jgi:hypothetical protein